MSFRPYLDEDSSRWSIADALRNRGVDVLTTHQTGMLRRSDADQLEWASSASRVIFTYNIGHFCKLHAQLLRDGQQHAGIIVCKQRMPIGEQLRRLYRLLNIHSGEE